MNYKEVHFCLKFQYLKKNHLINYLLNPQVSSSEYFSVCFDTENGLKDKDEIFIAATKGIALG
jgi:hypothetical protein